MNEFMPDRDDYYRELEPEKRREILNRLLEEGPDDGANAYRRLLFEARHAKGPRDSVTPDRFLFNCVSFVQLYRTAKTFLFRRSAAKEVREAFKMMRFADASMFGPSGEQALYNELRNAASRYFKTCESGNYGRAVFGLVSASDNGRRDRMCRDAWQMSCGLAMRLHMEEEMRVWIRAVTDAYIATDGEAGARFEACDRAERERKH